ncbi:DNA-directed RNA polymerase subunit delta [Candidatus Phytoplasma oryzae]|nr:DNA-directed RNA polymerase subunit delta [Candidatus Phytoplasma oryzae]
MKKSIFEKSMLDLSYEILKKNKKPMSIYKLINKVFKIKKINSQDKQKISQLYLDIVLSGSFVFHGNNLWSIKEGYLNFWDRDYFSHTEDENNNYFKQEQEEIEKKIFNFDDFVLKKNEIEENSEEEKDNDLIEEDVYSVLNLSNDEIKKKFTFSNEDEEENDKEDNIDNIEDYEFLDDENK